MDEAGRNFPFVNAKRTKKKTAKDIIFLKTSGKDNKDDKVLPKQYGTAVIIPFLVLCYLIAILGCMKLLNQYNDLNFFYILGIFATYTVGVWFVIKQQIYLDKGELPETIALMLESKEPVDQGLINTIVELFQSSSGKYIFVAVAISGILTTLGIVGTILGLTLSMGGLKQLVTSAGNNGAIASEMNKILSGVDVSFYTTLFGAFFGGISLKLCTLINSHYLRGNVIRVHEKLITLAGRHSVQGLNALLQNNGKETAQTLLQLRKIYNVLSKEIHNSTKSLMQFEKSIGNLPLGKFQNDLSTLGAQIGGVNSETVSLIDNIGNVKFSKELEKSAGAINKFEKSVKKFSIEPVHDELAALAEKIGTVNNESLTLVTNIKKMLGQDGQNK